MKTGRTREERIVRKSQMGVVSDPTWDYGVVLACAATRDHSWAHGPEIARVYYNQGCPWSGLPPGDMMMAEGCT